MHTINFPYRACRRSRGHFIEVWGSQDSNSLCEKKREEREDGEERKERACCRMVCRMFVINLVDTMRFKVLKKVALS
jgi:hypothetical protein